MAGKRIYVGIDGGATKTDFAAVSDEGALLARLKREGANPTVCGMAKTEEILYNGLNDLAAALEKYEDIEVCGVFAGVAGCPDDERRKALIGALHRVFPGVPAGAHADIVNVFYSSDRDGDCFAAICGTGSVVFAKKGERLFRVGGWGAVFDTAGSGFDIGRDALRACLAQEDGFGERTALLPMVKSLLGPSVFEGASRLSYNDTAFIASFAPLVFTAAKEGDGAAKEILRRNFARLAFLIERAAELYSCEKRVILSGGLTGEKEIFEEFFLPLVTPVFEVEIAAREQVFGAARAAREASRFALD